MEIEELLDDYGTAWRTAQAAPPLPDHTRLHRRRPPAPLLAAGVIATAIASTASVIGFADHDSQAINTVSPPVVGASIPGVPRTSTHAGKPNHVPAPYDGSLGGGIGPLCPGPLSGRLSFTPTDSGTVGTLVLSAPAQCAVAIGAEAMTLLDAAGHPLAVTVRDRPSPKDNPPEYPTVVIQPGQHAYVTLGWRGSWCGPAPATLLVKGGGTYQNQASTNVAHDMTAPVDGSPPACTTGPTGTIDVSPAGGAGGVPPAAPADWEQLRLSVTGHVNAKIVNAVLTISNPTDASISLVPCPGYAMTAAFGASPVGMPHSNLVGKQDILHCADAPDHVPAHGSVEFPVSISVGAVGPRGVDVNVSIAGAPSAPMVTIH